MAKAEQFNVQTNIDLVFDSEGKHYKMKLLIENGIIVLEDNEGKEQYIFLGDKEEYWGEPIKEPLPEIESKPKKKRKRSKKKNQT
jgi:hypothetical protein